jgi:hypothetical protein
MWAVVVADVAVDTEYVFERRLVATTPDHLRALASWFIEYEVDEVVMESTAQYGRPVWEALEREWQPTRRCGPTAGPASGALHLAHAQSNQGPRGRKKDFPGAERLVKRLVADELTLSFVPESPQRLWRTVTRRKYQLRCNRVQLQNRLESLLEEAHIKVSRRRLLNHAANAAVKTKGSICELVYRRLGLRLGHAQAIGAIAHRLCRLVWKILHEGVGYEERGPAVTRQRAQRRAAKMIRELRSLGYRIDLPSPSESPA